MQSTYGVTSTTESDPVVLGVWRPQTYPNPTDFFLTPDQIQMGLNYQGMLVYSGSFMDQATYDPNLGLSKRFFTAYVDAQTGTLLRLDFNDEWPLGASAKHRGLVIAPLSWDWAPGPTAVFAGKKTAEAPAGDVLSASAPGKMHAGIPLFLHRARMTVMCRYDRASGLIWQDRPGPRCYGRPNKALRAAILKVLPRS